LSKFRCPEGDDHPDAAGKHLLDAMTLEKNGRFDGAAYLSGYVVECSLKTLIILQTKKPIRGHKLNELSNRVLELAKLPTSKTARYNKVISSKLSISDPVNGWKETMRYRASGSLSPADAEVWVNEAVTVYQSTVAQMKLDGIL
jgi:HEPN domain-containing protein